MADWTITCDGGYRKLGRRPGVATYACLVRRGTETIYQESGVVCRGRAAQNVMAEYAAVLAALRWLLTSGPAPGASVIIQSDSRYVVERLNGRCRIRRKYGVVMLHQLAVTALQSLQKRGQNVRVCWVPRKQVNDAHRLCTLAYSGPAKGAHRHLKAFLRSRPEQQIGAPEGGAGTGPA